MKDLLIIVATILILVILIDGIRRKRNERYGSIKVSRSLRKNAKLHADDEESDQESPSYTSELPNGGARVVGQRDPGGPIPSIEKKAQAKSYIEKRSRLQGEPPIVERRREPEQASLNLGESVPMLMESVDDARVEPVLHESPERIEPGFGAMRDDDIDGYDIESEQGRYMDDERDYDEDDHDTAYTEVDEADYEGDDPYGNADPEDDIYEQQEEDPYDANQEESRQNLTSKQPAEPEEVLIINVMAHKGQMFNGGDLLDIILKCGLRYGSMDIFHRYSDAKGEGALLFSMANMVKPGTFDLDAMDEFETPGVSLFMTLPIDADSMQSFELMVDTAHAIADGLDGEMKDEQRSAMTRQTLEHCRQRIRDFERMRLFRRPPRH